ncbi:TonB-dependent receptor family protein [Glaciimonas immobilis]|uniref:Iron complex outermembrane receptor protein n=1 Tax=Glaciimonas immobilis TaxID=728004 RepID=A0A840RQU4_9BURK|nr:TonB-dependent receptor [Glaciimonas immobilis]KAF3999456.1 TonB-dependent receptor [Glaciimonas immobilis]MBB5198970.1 iron complex outermembrane receptor protein [Glaciimonas immobilis]
MSIAADGPGQSLQEVVVSASRSEQSVMDTAASIDVVNARQIHDGTAEQNMSEPLARTPGIFALNRQNYAQDLLISSRGFGANSAFGARGIKIFVDGIPGTAADGQGQISHIDLASADHIEVMRGPFSVLYGNSAGGVINVFTENGKPGAEVMPYFSSGSFGQRKYGVKIDGDENGINYLLDAGALHTDGYREHSAADRNNENAKLRFKLTPDTSVTVVANRVHLTALDPLGLTAAQLQTNPRGAGTGADAFATRKSVDQTQVGVTLNQRISATDSLTFTPYGGERKTTQFLASAVNGVINLKRDFFGMDSKWLHAANVGGMPLKLVAGVDANENRDHRLTYSNVGGQQRVAPTDQDYSMEARNLDFYLQGELHPTDRLAFTAGVRQSEITLSADSNNNLASLGSRTYQAVTGMISAQYYVQENANVYVSYGAGFDTPTLNQIIYSPSYVTSGGTNTGNMKLNAARTKQVEIGYKSEISKTALVKIALFHAETTDDIVLAASNGGKSSYMNAPKTRRDGLELSTQVNLPYNLQANVSYTLLDAKVAQTYAQTVTNPATNASTSYSVASGRRIPGVPDQGLFAELVWRKPDNSLELAVEGRAAGSIVANDVNKAYAGGYGLMNLRAVFRQAVGKWTISEFARVDNLFDHSYVGSVIVNQANSQFYESAPGRNWLAGLSASYRF